MPFAEVVFNLPLFHSFTYNIPAHFENLQPGKRVLVPFGKRTLTGIVTGLKDKAGFSTLKDILDILDDKPLISAPMMELTQWIAEYYFCSWGQALHLALPKGIDEYNKETIHLLREDGASDLTERQRELYLLIGENPGLSKQYYRKKFGYGSFYYFLERLQEKGVIRIEQNMQKARAKSKLRKFVSFAENYLQEKEEHKDYLKYIKKRPQVEAFILALGGKEILMSEFLKETKMANGTLYKIESYGLCSIEKKPLARKPQFAYSENEKDYELTEEQEKAVAAIYEKYKKGQFSVSLLHGVTGSGKTQVYIEILKKVIAGGKTGLILIPEISLTPQTVFRFQAAFKQEIAVFHSKMSMGERFDAWNACYKGKIKIVVGPRSALFAPLQNIGLIVVDEEHSTTYKQSDVTPRYNARDAAIYWARLNEALVILGSATPSLESYYNARNGKYHLLEIRNRVDNIRMPDVQIVDMKQKRVRLEHKITLFSELLLEKIHTRLQRKEQVILLQNRRGYSSFMQCPQCGFIPVCPNCDIGLTYHSYNEQLRCHLCGYQRPASHNCENCGGKQIVYKGVGTQRIEKELQQLLPAARILRMDQDTTRGKNSHDEILNLFGRAEADILLGTQMIAKGLDFENVTLVGVISADVGLALPDFRSGERVFQLLTQVAGRAGRGAVHGEVVVQSYLYSHFAIQMAKAHDFTGFYMEEIRHRQNYKYPPFYRLIQILISSEKISEAISIARTIAVNINRRAGGRYCTVLGPAPAVIARMNNLYRWQVLLKLSPQTDPAGKHSKKILRQILEPYISKRTQGLYVTVDVDPQLMH